MIDFPRAASLLQAAGMADAASEPLDFDGLAQEVGRSVDALRADWDRLEASGLVLSPPDEGLPPRLTHAGRQYLARRGDVSGAVLDFLPHTIDDLVARRALLAAGTIVVDEFRAALLSGNGLEHAGGVIVPPAFADAITDDIALDLFAACVALIARLSCEQPAGCVAEEIVAVALIEEATAWIGLAEDAGRLEGEEARRASDELRGLFELFQDDDVLDLFDMQQPEDAAVQGHSDVSRQLGVVDQRVEAWFEPFGWTAPTGYLSDAEGDDE